MIKKAKRTVSIVTATDAKNRFGEMLKRAYAANEELIIEKGGIPVAAIIPITVYEQLVNLEALPAGVAQQLSQASRLQNAHESMREFLDQMHARMPDVSEAEGEQDVDQAVREVRSRRR